MLDAPELMWAEPQLEPVYRAVRGYLEMDQRVDLLQERLGVVGDLLAVLKGELGHTHGESTSSCYSMEQQVAGRIRREEWCANVI